MYDKNSGFEHNWKLKTFLFWPFLVWKDYFLYNAKIIRSILYNLAWSVLENHMLGHDHLHMHVCYGKQLLVIFFLSYRACIFLKFCPFLHNLLLTLQSKLKMGKHKTSSKGFSTLFELFRSFMFPLSILIQKNVVSVFKPAVEPKKDITGWAW